MNKADAPLKDFGYQRTLADNKEFTHYCGMPFIVGQLVRGTWVDGEGKTYYCEGKIIFNEKSGYWVEDSSEGITPVCAFWILNFDNR
jgi:hypothetical protein